MQGKSCGIFVSLIVVEFQVYHAAILAGHVGVQAVNDTGDLCLGGCFRGISHVLFLHNPKRRYHILLDGRRIRSIRLPSHYIVAIAGHNQISHSVYIEGTVSGEEIILSIADYKERLSGQHDVKGIVGGLCRALAGNGCFDRPGLGTKTDLPGVNAAHTGGGICT